MGKQVALQPLVDGPSAASGHAIAAYAGAVEMHPHGWKTSSRVQLHPLVVQVLLRDAVAIENNRISGLQVEALRPGGLKVWRNHPTRNHQTEKKTRQPHLHINLADFARMNCL
jgi:hypothetical protein